MRAAQLTQGLVGLGLLIGCPARRTPCEDIDLPQVVFDLQDPDGEPILWQPSFTLSDSGEALECYPWDGAVGRLTWGCFLPRREQDVEISALGYGTADGTVEVPLVPEGECPEVGPTRVVQLPRLEACVDEMAFAIELSVIDPSGQPRDDARLYVQNQTIGAYQPGSCELIAPGRYGCMQGYGGVIDVTIEVAGFSTRAESFTVDVDACGPLTQSRSVRVQ